MELEGHCCPGFPDFRRSALQLERHCACPARGWRGHFKLVARYIAVVTTFREVEPKRSSTARALIYKSAGWQTRHIAWNPATSTTTMNVSDISIFSDDRFLLAITSDNTNKQARETLGTGSLVTRVSRLYL